MRFYTHSGFFRRIRDPIRVLRVSNRVSWIRENYHRVPKLKENRVPSIKEIGSLKIQTRFLTFSLKKTCNMERFFSWCRHKPKRKTNLSGWTSFYIKLVWNLKHLSCKQFQKTVKGDSTFLGNLRNLQNTHGLNWLSK